MLYCTYFKSRLLARVEEYERACILFFIFYFVRLCWPNEIHIRKRTILYRNNKKEEISRVWDWICKVRLRWNGHVILSTNEFSIHIFVMANAPSVVNLFVISKVHEKI